MNARTTTKRLTLLLPILAFLAAPLAMAQQPDRQPPPRDAGGSISVEVVGTLRTGIMAIGGETTGTTISAEGLTWELDLRGNKELTELAQKCDGKMVYVKGPLTVKEGVERGPRMIVQVKELKLVESKK